MGSACGKSGGDKNVLPTAQKNTVQQKKKITHKGKPFTTPAEARKAAEAWCNEPENLGWIYTGINSLEQGAQYFEVENINRKASMASKDIPLSVACYV